MLNNVIKLKIEEENYEISINIGKMINCERISGKSFIPLVQEAEQGSILALSQILSECLSKDGKSVGIDFISGLDFDVFDELIQPLIGAINNSFPDSSKKKVEILTPIK